MSTAGNPTALLTARAFRVVAIAEACSWAGLLIGMFFKYVVVLGEVGVQVFGPIHGALWVAYLVVAAVAWRVLRWPFPTVVLAVVCSIPPFASLWFERRVRRAGLVAMEA